MSVEEASSSRTEADNWKAVAWSNIILGSLILIFSCWSLGVAWWASGQNERSPGHFHEGMLLIAVVLIGGTLLPVGLLQTFAGWKLLEKKTWAKRTILFLVWGEVLGLVPFVGSGKPAYVLFPFVAALAGYSTWVLQIQRQSDAEDNVRTVE